jgi:lipoprotein-releasing system permease protein
MLLVDGVMKPALLRGVDPEAESKVSNIAGQMKQGRFDSLRPGSFNVVLGRSLATSLGVEVGDRVTLLIANGEALGGAAASGQNPLPRTRALTVSGIFQAGHFEFDSTLALANVEDVQAAAGVHAPAGLRLRLADLQEAPRVALELRSLLPEELFLRDWTKVNAVWFAAVQSQKRMMFIILTMIVAVAAFNLVSTLVMTVKDKQADIAILRTLGSSPRSIMKIFMVQGTLVGLLGAGLGVLLGVTVALNVDVIVPFIERVLGVHFLSQEVYLISEMPSELVWNDVAWIGGVAVLLSFFATIYPSWSASRTRPAEALRYE